MFLFLFNTMPSHTRCAALERTKREDITFLFAENPSELVKEIIQVVVNDHRDEVQGEPKLICEDTSEVRANTTKFIDCIYCISVHVDSFKKAMPSAKATDKAGQLRNDVNAILEGTQRPITQDKFFARQNR